MLWTMKRSNTGTFNHSFKVLFTLIIPVSSVREAGSRD